VTASGDLQHPLAHHEADPGHLQGRSAGSGDNVMETGAGSSPGDVQGSAIHRRRWSGIPGGEQEARHRGGVPQHKGQYPWEHWG
jgi:hypothetical protein